MGEAANMILNGTLDYISGEYLGNPCGYPRTIYSKSNLNKYGYNKNEWRRINYESKEVIKFLYSLGFKKIIDRQKIIDKYFKNHLKWIHIPKNNRKYKLIYERFNEFKDIVIIWKEGTAVR